MKIHLCLMLILTIFSCTNKVTTTPQSIKVPEGWSKTKTGNFNLIQSPEKDLKIYFHVMPIENSKKLDFSKISQTLWKEINPLFVYPELQTTSPPDKKGWDKISQIVYKIPSDESKMVVSILRVKNEQAYINLITTTHKTFSKRSAQMMTLVESWKHPAINDKNYANVKVKTFDDQEATELDKFIKNSQKVLKIPAISIGIVHNGKIIYKKGFGLNSNVDSQTLFMIGSITKPLTTLMMAKLVNDGLMKWEDKLSNHLPKWSLENRQATDSIIMKHAACACTGMPRRDLDFIFKIKNITPEQRIAEMKDMKPTTKAGETFQYSNYLVAAGGFAAAKTYHPKTSLAKSYTKAMNDLVLTPLKMSRTLITHQPPYDSNTAEPYLLNLELKPTPVAKTLEKFANSLAPAGSIWSNVDDMLKYVQFEIEGGKNLNGYINAKHLLERRKKGIQVTKNTYYGLGLFADNLKGIEYYHHGGNTMGFTANMFFIPSKRIGAVILTNLGQINSFQSALREKVFQLLLGTESKAEEKISYTKQQLEKRNKRIIESFKTQISSPQKLVGQYKSKALGSMIIKQQGKALMATFEEFSSELKEKKDSGKKRVFLLTAPPWIGGLELLLDGKDFVIDDAQQKYRFKKI